MSILRRIFLFMVVNLLVVITVSFLLSLLGVGTGMQGGGYGIDYTELMVFCLVWGMAGSLISLGLSRMIAKWSMGVQVVDPDRASGAERQLLSTVYGLAQKAGISKMPEVGIYNSPEVNAFATGPTRNRSLVAVSSGLLQRMNQSQVEGVLSHEVAHIANGDMVTMTLLQGIINAFVLFFARVIAMVVTQNMRDGSRHAAAMGIRFALELILGLLGMVVVAWFSRFREFRADIGGARLGGKGRMVQALQGLRQLHEIQDPTQRGGAVQSFKISGRMGFARLFSTHPPLEERIARLETLPTT